MASPPRAPRPIRQRIHPPLVLNTNKRIPILRGATHHPDPEPVLPIAHSKQRPQLAADIGGDGTTDPAAAAGAEGSVYFIGTATTVIGYAGARLLTDPNFLHAGDHVHLGAGVTATRRTEPAVADVAALPPVDCVLLSHYHEDHFDRGVERRLARDLPVLTTPHARACLEAVAPADGGPFRRVRGLDPFDGILLPVVGDEQAAAGVRAAGAEGRRTPAVRVTGMPGKHVPAGMLARVNELLGAVPPTNGWLVELGWTTGAWGGAPGEDGEEGFAAGYRIYISGDTLMVDELKEIPERLRGDRIDLMLVHLGGTTVPGPQMPLVMVTMDGEQGVQLMRLVDPGLTIPVHFDDYDVFCSPLDDFKKEVEAAGLAGKVVYLDRGDEFRFTFSR
ncbi:hypothetical protein VTH06DRAFT_3123 [Thermothelomyces fergusii]